MKSITSFLTYNLIAQYLGLFFFLVPLDNPSDAGKMEDVNLLPVREPRQKSRKLQETLATRQPV